MGGARSASVQIELSAPRVVFAELLAGALDHTLPPPTAVAIAYLIELLAERAHAAHGLLPGDRRLRPARGPERAGGRIGGRAAGAAAPARRRGALHGWLLRREPGAPALWPGAHPRGRAPRLRRPRRRRSRRSPPNAPGAGSTRSWRTASATSPTCSPRWASARAAARPRRSPASTPAILATGSQRDRRRLLGLGRARARSRGPAAPAVSASRSSVRTRP